MSGNCGMVRAKRLPKPYASDELQAKSPLQHVGHRWPGLDIVVPAQLSQRGCRHRYSQIRLEDLRVVSNLLWGPLAAG